MSSSSSTTTSRRSPARADLRVVATSAVAIVVATSGCFAHSPAPKSSDARLLYRDLERQVTVTSATGWGADKLEIDELLKATLDSVCRVHPLARRELARWLDGELRLRGDVKTAWRANGKDLSRVEELLTMTRVQKLLARAEEQSIECPFWLEPESPFRGRQVSEHRWSILFSGGGKGIAVHTRERDDISFGGAARLLFGRSFEDANAIYAGLELGASAQFPKNAMGERTSLRLGVDLVTPIVYRATMTNTYVEGEIGYLGRANESDWSRFDNGIHVGMSFGGRALRQRFVFPGAAFTVSFERTFDDDVTLIKVGGRVTFDLDL